jgi:hypothetical protein
MFSESFDLVLGNSHTLAKSNDIEVNVELARHERFLLQVGAWHRLSVPPATSTARLAPVEVPVMLLPAAVVTTAPVPR